MIKYLYSLMSGISKFWSTGQIWQACFCKQRFIEHSHAHSFTNCLCLILRYKAELSSCMSNGARDHPAHKIWNYYLDLHRKSLRTPSLCSDSALLLRFPGESICIWEPGACPKIQVSLVNRGGRTDVSEAFPGNLHRQEKRERDFITVSINLTTLDTSYICLTMQYLSFYD